MAKQIDIIIVCINTIDIIIVYNNNNISTNITTVCSRIIVRRVLWNSLVLKNTISYAQDMHGVRASFAVMIQYLKYSYV